MQQRDRDVLEHMIRYCDRIAGYLDNLENSKPRFMEEQMCQDDNGFYAVCEKNET